MASSASLPDSFTPQCHSCNKTAAECESPKKSLFPCTGCQLVHYCSKACQSTARKSHEVACQAAFLLTLIEDPRLQESQAATLVMKLFSPENRDPVLGISIYNSLLLPPSNEAVNPYNPHNQASVELDFYLASVLKRDVRSKKLALQKLNEAIQGAKERFGKSEEDVKPNVLAFINRPGMNHLWMKAYKKIYPDI